ncbi:hypothetical protein BJ165DRAFT_1535144 [Panaeolus papilionaceus]|nr:hypothetical protein BJ165DRAFT_1535144 [Panaeolus papilionaceus]
MAIKAFVSLIALGIQLRKLPLASTNHGDGHRRPLRSGFGAAVPCGLGERSVQARDFGTPGANVEEEQAPSQRQQGQGRPEDLKPLSPVLPRCDNEPPPKFQVVINNSTPESANMSSVVPEERKSQAVGLA